MSRQCYRILTYCKEIVPYLTTLKMSEHQRRSLANYVQKIITIEPNLTKDKSITAFSSNYNGKSVVEQNK